MTEDERNRLREKADQDQKLKEASQVLPALWRSVYLECISQGFTEHQSMELVKTMIMSTGGTKP